MGPLGEWKGVNQVTSFCLRILKKKQRSGSGWEGEIPAPGRETAGQPSNGGCRDSFGWSNLSAPHWACHKEADSRIRMPGGQLQYNEDLPRAVLLKPGWRKPAPAAG